MELAPSTELGHRPKNSGIPTIFSIIIGMDRVQGGALQIVISGLARFWINWSALQIPYHDFWIAKEFLDNKNKSWPLQGAGLLFSVSGVARRDPAECLFSTKNVGNKVHLSVHDISQCGQKHLQIHPYIKHIDTIAFCALLLLTVAVKFSPPTSNRPFLNRFPSMSLYPETIRQIFQDLTI